MQAAPDIVLNSLTRSSQIEGNQKKQFNDWICFWNTGKRIILCWIRVWLGQGEGELLTFLTNAYLLRWNIKCHSSQIHLYVIIHAGQYEEETCK